MRMFFLIILTLFLSIDIARAESFTALGENFNVNLSNNLCILNENDPVEKNILQNARATTPDADIPVFFIDCSSLKQVKSGVFEGVFKTYGGIKNLKQKFIFSSQTFLDAMEKRLNIDSSSLNELIDKNGEKGGELANLDTDISVSGTKFLGKDKNTLYLGGKGSLNGTNQQFISAFTLQKGVIFNIEIYSSEMQARNIINTVISIKEQLK